MRRAPRADAKRNRERVLAAAEVVFAEQGIAASTEEVARAAGVGIGTVFRHFPAKADLLQAVLVSRLGKFATEVQALADDRGNDAGAAFYALLTRAVDQSATKNAVAAALADAGIHHAAATLPVLMELRSALNVLLARAQQAGAVRDDIGVDDLICLLVGATRAAEYAGWNRAVMDRTVAVISAGLRPPPRE